MDQKMCKTAILKMAKHCYEKEINGEIYHVPGAEDSILLR